jgi:NADH dehydrogenase [ubiquinone] 1 alpha subcomplex assembly factor 7
VTWHRSLDEVPEGLPTLFIAHEFFDALPVHQFQLTRDHGWCERLVDLAEEPGPLHLRLVLSPGKTVAGSAVLRPRMMALPPDKRTPFLCLPT